ncbi:MAG: peptidylprolyl isomerase, partial [Rhodobacteraceae bacterium]|nr:peptidylprolyl isomerase [Paracoccaceae bacterium]
MTAGMNGVAALRRLTGGIAATLLLAAPVLAQSSPFSPALFVNERVISHYELEQRIAFMTLLRQPGDIEQVALDSLIDDRLRLYEAAQLGIKATPEMVEAGMAEFASRANLSTEEFLKAIGQGGV